MRGCYYKDGVINRFSLAVTKMFQLGRYQQMGSTSSCRFLFCVLLVLFRATQSKLCIKKGGTYLNQAYQLVRSN